MAPKKKALYKVQARYMVFGTVPGNHIPHMFEKPAEKIKGFVPVTNTADIPKSNGYDEVGRAELYSNDSENLTKLDFMQLAMQSEKDYAENENDNDMDKLLFSVRDYVLAGGRESQQNAYQNMKICAYNCHLKYTKQLEALNAKGVLSAEETEEKKKLQNKTKTLSFYTAHLKRSYGNLEVKNEDKVPPETIEEPANTMLGKVGYWSRSYEALFPHKPSPNDIKQGVGLQDCFALSVITQIADNDPDYIMNMMKDNGNGTVSVKFYNTVVKKDPNDKKKEIVTKEPEIITVKKTVRKDLTGHNIYSSSSLWVQMLEKAYAEYNSRHPEGPFMGEQGMKAAWRGDSCWFMDAFLPDKYEGGALLNNRDYMLYKRNEKGEMVNHPDYYLPDEIAYFDKMKELVDNKEIMTVMPDKHNFMISSSEPHDVGLRNGHIYTVRKLFKNEDGKMFVQLRDPYAVFSPGYKDGKLVNNSSIVGGTLKGGIDSMGTFNLEFKDFLEYYNNFSGISEKARDQLMLISERDARYLDDAPLKPEEFQSVEKYNKLWQKEAAEGRKLRSSRLDKQRAFIGKLKNPETLKEFQEQINEIVEDIKSTDEAFVLTNSKEFKQMKKDLYKFNDTLKNILENKEPYNAEELLQGMQDVRFRSSEYIRNKEQSISETMAKGKVVSDRAFHRLVDAISLNNILNFEAPISKWPSKQKESFSIYRADLETKLAVLGNASPEEKEKNFNEINRTERKLAKLDKLMLKNEQVRRGEKDIKQDPEERIL